MSQDHRTARAELTIICVGCGSSEGMARAVTVNRAEAMSSLLAVPA